MTILDANESQSLQGGPSFSLRNRLFRLAWILTWQLLAAWTPRPLNRWRCFVARAFGAQVGTGASIYGSARIWLPSRLSVGAGATIGPRVNCYTQAQITIGNHSIVSQGAHLCAGTHDHRDPGFQLIARPILIGERVWIAAEAFVGPGVTIGEGAVLGARACTFRNLDPWAVYSGNPAQRVADRVLRQPAPR